jgi:N-acetylglucosamine-6-phosphate deacetylase
MVITNIKAYIGHKFVDNDLRIENGAITEIGKNLKDADIIDGNGMTLVPGFIDIHTHGGMGIDVSHATEGKLKELSSFFASQGTTGYLTSVMTDTEEHTKSLLGTIGPLVGQQSGGARILGIHLEGPFLSPLFKGAMPEELLRKGDAKLLDAYLEASGNTVRYITVAPEVEGTIDLIRKYKDRLTFAIGHSGADYDTAMEAIDAGAESATHLFNAMQLFHMHRPAISGAALLSDIAVEIIADGRHLHPATVALVLKTKGNSHVVAITDSIMAAGLPDGEYQLGRDEVVVEDGDAKLKNGVRAGSTLTTCQALRNLVKFTGKSVEELLPLLTENPAKLVRVADRKGSIEVGKDADLVLLDGNLDVMMTIVGGEIVYKKEKKA